MIPHTANCALCHCRARRMLPLNDGRFICASCFDTLIYVHFPERYESVYRQYIWYNIARDRARQALIQHSRSRRAAVGVGGVCVVTALLSFATGGKYFFAVIITLFLWWMFYKRHRNLLTIWEEAFPPAEEPLIRHFYDPKAVLTDHDRRVLSVFDHWPGYPPYWEYVQKIVLDRDNKRCQVTGCPSRVQLNLHHIVPLSKGGSHAPDNLVTLCEFHHALEDDVSHEKTWSRVSTRFFTLVRQHLRSNPVNPGMHLVRAHLRRLELVTGEDLQQISDYYGFSCPYCSSKNLQIIVSCELRAVNVRCVSCKAELRGPRQLAEETGPLLGELLKITRNRGRWKARWEALSKRVVAEYRTWRCVKPPVFRTGK